MVNDNLWMTLNFLLLVLLIRRKYLFLLFTIYVLCNGFSFFDRDFFYIQGFFRFRDIIFLVLIIITIFTSNPDHNKILKSSFIKKIILLLIICNFALAIYTYYRWDYTINELIAVSRDYPLYLIIISTIILIKNEKDLVAVIKISQYFIILFSIIFIIQVLIGQKIQLFPYPYKFAEEQILEQMYFEKVIRLRAWGKLVPSYFIYFFFSMYVFNKDKKDLIFFGLCFLATFLTFDRTIVFASIVALPFSVYIVQIFKKRYLKTRMHLRKLLVPIGGLLLFIFLLNLVSETIFKNIITRYSSMTTQIVERTGTYGDRIDKLEYAFHNIFPDNLFLGVGLYHVNHYSDFIRENVYPDGHIGIFYILITTGIFFWLLYFSFIIYILFRYLKRFNLIRNPLYKSFLFMIIASTLTKLIAWHYQEFNDPISITVFAFMIGVAELCIYYDKQIGNSE